MVRLRPGTRDSRSCLRGSRSRPRMRRCFCCTAEEPGYAFLAALIGPRMSRKQPTRRRFVQLLLEYYQISATSHSRIPYESGWLSAYRFPHERPKGTVVVFGGFDSYIEEWLPAAFTFSAAGDEVILFEGPGQGSVLEDAHLTFTPEWEKPVKAVLDFYQLNNVTLMGFSLGGGLVVRAAAFEPRAQRVIAYAVLTDFLEGYLRPFPAPVRDQLLAWLANGNYDSFQVYQHYQTAPISSRVTQDVLLMAGAQDHYVPAHQFYDQSASLTNVRSLTARLFTSYEQAQNHCQVGNFGLAFRTVIEWTESLQFRDARLQEK